MAEVYEHYHISIDTEKGMIELVVERRGPMWYVIDDWGEFTGVSEAVMARFDTAELAVKHAVTELKKEYPKGKLMHGAGCPPKEWLQ